MECCQTTPHLLAQEINNRILLVGNPNVGKSMLFYRLTGRYVTVSNYPGTTVEISQGDTRTEPRLTVIDTPGIIAFPARTEDEAVTARVLLNNQVRSVLQVADAKNLRRSLLLTIQLAEMQVPMVVALNMMDEMQARGLQLETSALRDAFGLTFLPTIASRGEGTEAVTEALLNAARVPRLPVRYPEPIETFIKDHSGVLPAAAISARSILLEWLSGDTVCQEWLSEKLDKTDLKVMEQARTALESGLAAPAADIIHASRSEYIESLANQSLTSPHGDRVLAAGWLSRLTLHPVWGLGFLALALYGFYLFVGVFGAGTLVGLFEETLFGQYINPWIVRLVENLSPAQIFTDFIVGEYGLWTIGITYATALLLPIVTTFFVAFGILEDSGYLPRLSVLSNRIFEKLGLNGKAILPMVLGLGCVTMATLTTRILESKRDRFLVIFLLALAVPCSAQLGVVMGMLAGISFGAALIWGLVVLMVLGLVGWLAARLAPGERSPLLVELPPLRLPVLSNVLLKTVVRLEWYIKEAVPLFLLGTVVLFVLDKIHVLPFLITAGEPLVSGWLGLPPEASASFLMGFLRRDFAATGLFAMQNAGLLNPVQVVVAIVTVTLFIPCVASLFMIAKERGWKTTGMMAAVIFPLAFLIGGILNRVLLLTGWNG